MEEELQQEYMKFQMLDQQIKQIQQQLEMLEQQMLELKTAKQSVDELKNAKVGSEILIPVSNGIFAKAELKDTSRLILNIGAKTAVSKDIPSTTKLIDSQIAEITKVQQQLATDLQGMTNHAQQLAGKLQTLQSKQPISK